MTIEIDYPGERQRRPGTSVRDKRPILMEAPALRYAWPGFQHYKKPRRAAGVFISA
ncbi:hypothetical protein OCEANICA350_11204 [Oceanicaulis sp. 350]|nr:hypothetical protein OCEANICA350_11204 [Oceanicaulis sp. 350]